MAGAGQALACASGAVVLVPDVLLTDADDDEEVPRVPRLHSKARQNCLARQCSGYDALPADCKFPWRPMGPWLILKTYRSSDPPSFGVAHAPAATVPLASTLSILPLKMLPSVASGSRHEQRGLQR